MATIFPSFYMMHGNPLDQDKMHVFRQDQDLTLYIAAYGDQ